MKISVLIFLLTIINIAAQCSKKPQKEINYQKVTWYPNPNGDSELALAMRRMFDDAFLLKQQISNGDKVTVEMDHEFILTAHATEPEKAASPQYKAFAESYLYAAKSLNEANKKNVEDRYNTLVTVCQTCHQKMCPGPLVRIKQLEFGEDN